MVVVADAAAIAAALFVADIIAIFSVFASVRDTTAKLRTPPLANAAIDIAIFMSSSVL